MARDEMNCNTTYQNILSTDNKVLIPDNKVIVPEQLISTVKRNKNILQLTKHICEEI